MSARILEFFLKEYNFSEAQEFTRKYLQIFHHICHLRNLNLSTSNYNIWQSNIFLFHYLGKVFNGMPKFSIQIQAFDLNDVQG
jgi:hypothetical protein